VKEIEVDEEVFGELQRRAEPLVDTPNSVLRKVLRLDKLTSSSGQATEHVVPKGKGLKRSYNGRLPAGVRTPAPEFRQSILKALVKLGGAAPKNNVLGTVGEMMAVRLNEFDRAKNKSGGIRWRNTAEWERFNMVQEGLLRRNSRRGVWELTDRGREAIGR
jgi:restriction endonuclease Mrr